MEVAHTGGYQTTSMEKGNQSLNNRFVELTLSCFLHGYFFSNLIAVGFAGALGNLGEKEMQTPYLL